MDLLNAATACLLFIAPQADCDASKLTRALTKQPQAADRIAPWDGIIAEAAHRFAVPADWIRSVMGVESGGRTMLDGQARVTPGLQGGPRLNEMVWNAS